MTTVQVGSQVSGALAWLGADFKSQVKRGQVIAKLDPAIFEAQLRNQQAGLQDAQAGVQAAMAEINNQNANLAAAKSNQRASSRSARDDAMNVVKRYLTLKAVLSGRELELAQAQANAAEARNQQATAQTSQAQSAVSSSRAKLEGAKAVVAQARAQLKQAQVNLSHATITSPIDGVVISRNVDVGQTVAASLQAPTLFVIANDLTDMQVLASIDEADVGQIHEGITANFTVDAYPGQIFKRPNITNKAQRSDAAKCGYLYYRYRSIKSRNEITAWHDSQYHNSGYAGRQCADGAKCRAAIQT